MTEIDEMKSRIDAIAGVQQAMAVAVKLAIVGYRGNPQAIAGMENGFEQIRSMLLASSSSDYLLHSFDETAASLVEALKDPL